MRYAKAVLAVLVAAAGALVTALGTGSTSSVGNIDAKHWILAAITVLGSGGIVWLCENVPGIAGGVIKAVVAFLSAGFGSLVIALDDNVITQAEWITAGMAAVAATGLVYQTTNVARLRRTTAPTTRT